MRAGALCKTCLYSIDFSEPKISVVIKTFFLGTSFLLFPELHPTTCFPIDQITARCWYALLIFLRIFPYEDGAQIVGRVLGKIDKEMIPSMEEQSLYLEALETLNL